MDSVVIAILGGFAGSAITAVVALVVSGRPTREAASNALWAYHRALLGFANRNYRDVGVDEDRRHLADAKFQDVANAFDAAYPWASFLHPAARHDLFRAASIRIGNIPWDRPDDLLTAARSAQLTADALERELERVFPRRFQDRLRAMFPSRYRPLDS